MIPKLLRIPLHEIDPPELPMRATMDEGKMRELMDSIAALGQQLPAQVKMVNGRYQIVTGHRRFMACQKLGVKDLLCMVYPKGHEPDAAAMLAENAVRENVNRAEEALWMAQLVEHHGFTEEMLCNKVQRGPDYIGDNFRLLRQDPLVFQAVLERAINFSVARELNKCQDAEHRKYLLDAALRSGTNARTVKMWVDQHKGFAPAVAGAPTESASTAPIDTPVTSPLACALCGGSKDPYNLVNIFIHTWELDRIRQLLAEAARGD